MTWGYNRTNAKISNTDFCDGTGLDKDDVSRAVRSLLGKNMIVRTESDEKRRPVYSVQKDYDRWGDKKLFVVKNDNKLQGQIVVKNANNRKSLLSKMTTIVVKNDNKNPAYPFIELDTRHCIPNGIQDGKRPVPFPGVSNEHVNSLLSVCQTFNGTSKILNPYAFINWALKHQHHPGAIIIALQATLKALQSGAVQKPWAFAAAIVQKESGNYRERAHIEEQQKTLKDWDSFVSSDRGQMLVECLRIPGAP